MPPKKETLSSDQLVEGMASEIEAAVEALAPDVKLEEAINTAVEVDIQEVLAPVGAGSADAGPVGKKAGGRKSGGKKSVGRKADGKKADGKKSGKRDRKGAGKRGGKRGKK